MIEILNVKSTFNVDKLIHTFIQNLGVKIKSPVYNNFTRVAFVTYIDRTRKIKQQLPCLIEKFNESNMQRKWDFTNEKDIQCFIEKHTNLYEILISLNNTGILTFPLKNINTKILQKVRKRKKDQEDTMKIETKIKKKRDSLSPISYKDKCHISSKYKRDKIAAVQANSTVLSNDVITLTDCKDINIFETESNDWKDFSNCNLSDNMINVVERKIEAAKKLLRLHTKDKEYIKGKMQVTLHISKKLNCNVKNQMKYNEILCQHAILCLIEPSEKAVVLFEDDLSSVIQKYLLNGYKHNFEFQRDSEDCYVALIILTRWAKVLVNHTNTTMMQTICGILGCDVQKILVLYNSEEKFL